MPIPAGVVLAAKYGPAAYGILKGLFGGKSPQKKAQERLEKIAREGIDPGILQRQLKILNARQGGESSDILQRLAGGNIAPSSGLAQEFVGASKRSIGGRQAEAQALFDEYNQRAKMQANQQLAGMPEDQSTGDLLGSVLSELQAQYGGGGSKKAMDFDNLDQMLSPQQPAAQSNIGIRLPSVQQTLNPQPRVGTGLQLGDVNNFAPRPAGYNPIGIQLPKVRQRQARNTLLGKRSTYGY